MLYRKGLLTYTSLGGDVTKLQSTLTKMDTIGTRGYREFRYSKMTENGAQGPTSGVRLIQVSVKRKLTVAQTDGPRLVSFRKQRRI